MWLQYINVLDYMSLLSYWRNIYIYKYLTLIMPLQEKFFKFTPIMKTILFLLIFNTILFVTIGNIIFGGVISVMAWFIISQIIMLIGFTMIFNETRLLAMQEQILELEIIIEGLEKDVLEKKKIKRIK